MKRKETCCQNEHEACADLRERRAKTMMSKIEGWADYESEMHDRPFNLLRAAKEHSLCHEETYREMAATHEALRDHALHKQKDNESLVDCVKRLKANREVFVSHLGGMLNLDKRAESRPTHDVTDRQNAKESQEEVDKRFATYLRLVNSDCRKRGSILKNLNEVAKE